MQHVRVVHKREWRAQPCGDVAQGSIDSVANSVPALTSSRSQSKRGLGFTSMPRHELIEAIGKEREELQRLKEEVTHVRKELVDQREGYQRQIEGLAMVIQAQNRKVD